MVVRGAPAIGQVAAIGLAMSAETQARRPALRPQGDAPRRRERADQRPPDRGQPALGGRAGAGPLHARSASCPRTASRSPRAMRAEADAIVFEATTDHGRLAGFGLEVLPTPEDRPVRILTHCNTGPLACGQYGTALGIVQAAHHAERPVHVWVDETRPYLQGARLTTWELAQAGVPHALLPDVAAGHLMSLGEVDVVLVGADRVAANGDTANKVGTYPLAVLAARHGIPFYVLRPDQLGRPRHGGRLGDLDRGALARRGPRVPRRPHRPARHRRPQPGLRRHAGRADHRDRHRGGRPARSVRGRPARRQPTSAREPLGIDARLPRDPAGSRARRAGTGRRGGTGRRRAAGRPARTPRSATDGHRRRRPARLDRHPGDDRQGPPARLPRA